MIKTLQAPLQGLFLRVEALFNSAFGDRLNPLYHLGQITFFLFWVVCGSGLYLYAFFETSVTDAYTSVQALTQRQWFAGGILRSVTATHRMHWSSRCCCTCCATSHSTTSAAFAGSLG